MENLPTSITTDVTSATTGAIQENIHAQPSAPTVANPGEPCHEGFFGLSESERAFRAEILHRAHSIWESKGRIENDSVADWLEAESELRKEK